MHRCRLPLWLAAGLVLFGLYPGSLTLPPIQASTTAEASFPGTLWAWGDNSSGQLGDGTLTQRLAPAAVVGLSGVSALSATHMHNLALKGDGTVWAWGNNFAGQLGDGTTTNRSTPVPVTGLSGVTALSAGALLGLALKADGTVWAWGSNERGQ